MELVETVKVIITGKITKQPSVLSLSGSLFQ